MNCSINKHSLFIISFFALISSSVYGQLVVNDVAINIPSGLSLVTNSFDIKGGKEKITVDGDFIIKGDIENHTNEVKAFDPISQGYVSIHGNQPQNLTGKLEFIKLELDNVNSFSIGQSSELLIEDNLRFLSGYIFNTDAEVSFLDDATHVGAHNLSFVEGGVTKKGDEKFIFPIGLNGVYKPFTKVNIGNSSDEFTVFYHLTVPNNILDDPLDKNIRKVCTEEYWEVTNTNSLDFNGAIPNVTSLCSEIDVDFLSIVQNENSNWNYLTQSTGTYQGLDFIESTDSKIANKQYYTYGETAHLVIDFTKVNAVDYTVDGSGFTKLNYNTGVQNILKITPNFPNTGGEDFVSLTVNDKAADGIGSLGVKVYYDDRMELTKVRADVGQGDQELVQDAYEFEDVYKLHFINPDDKANLIKTNLIAGKKFNLATGKLAIDIPQDFGVISSSLSVQQLQPTQQSLLSNSTILEWVATPTPGVYQYNLQLTTNQGIKMLSGQFIVE